MRFGPLLLVLGVLALAATPAAARPHPSRCKNVITGTLAPESLQGGPGNDRIVGLGGDDRLIGGAGDDCLEGGFDSDQLIGEGGDDRLTGGSGDDLLDGGPGADDLLGGEGIDSLAGGAGGDRLWGGGARDSIRGGDGADVLRGQGGNDRLYGGAGPDRLLGGGGADVVTEVPAAYTASDPLDTGRNHVAGGAGRDVIDVANGRVDTVDCGSGRDTVKADKGDHLKHCERRRNLISPFPEVSPRGGGRTRAFMVVLRSIQLVGPSRDWFSILVKGPRGCGSLEASSAGMTYHPDRAVRYRLRPFHGKGKKAKRWCRGRYHGRVSYSRPGAKDVTIGGFSFKVRG
jgi:hypothetical protein